MSSVKEAIKIGEVNFQEFRTDFLLMPKVKEYLERNNISLAGLLPEGHLWYEHTLFDVIDQNEDSEMDLGKEFSVVYTGIVEKRDFVDELSEEGFNDKPEDCEEILLESDLGVKDFLVKFMLLKK
jgi:hypothetical protein